MDNYRKLPSRKATALGFVSGVLAGLVAVTPAAGVVQVSGAIALGIIAIQCLLFSNYCKK